MKTKSSGPVTTIKFDLTGDCDLGAQYLAKIKDTPFDITGREDHADSAHANDPLAMNWRVGDELPEHLRPAPGELPVEAAPSPWPRIVPVDQADSDAAQSGEPPPEPRPWPTPAEPALEAAVTAAEQNWPTPSLADPTERQPWETVATADDAQDGYRYRAESDTDGDGEGSRRDGFQLCLLAACGSEARQFTHVPGERGRAMRVAMNATPDLTGSLTNSEAKQASAGQHLTGQWSGRPFSRLAAIFSRRCKRPGSPIGSTVAAPSKWTR